ncbi:MAG: TetR/AcrR family transcriptional regulator [Blastocatellia bacterium]|nr:TetR/AcrR family transcriptional regulator [Blastocatellia bacterium]
MRKIAQRTDIRDLILDATAELLARYGYKKMTIDDVAGAVGIGKGTVYLHFSSKEDLILSHIDRIVDRVKLELERIAASSLSPEQKIAAMLQARVLLRFDSVQHYSQSLNDLLTAVRSNLLVRHENHFAAEAALFASVLGEGKKRGSFACEDPQTTAAALIHATNSFLPYSLSPKELGLRATIEQQVACLAQVLLYGLVQAPGSSGLAETTNPHGE